MYRLDDLLSAERLSDTGVVRLVFRDRAVSNVAPESWAELVAAVSAGGLTPENLRRAEALHNGETLPPLPS